MRQVESLLFQMRPRGQEYNNLFNETEEFCLNSNAELQIILVNSPILREKNSR